MKQINAKRVAAAAVSLTLLLGLAGCGGGQSSSAVPQSNAGSAASGQPEEEDGIVTTGEYRTGLGIVVNASVSERTGTASSTVAAVVLDGEGKIVSAVLDVAENKGSVNEDGTLAESDSFQTKQEKGDSYRMIERSGIGKEWYEQANAFCAYIVGMTADEVAAIPTDGSDADLAAGCTIGVEGFIQAVTKACANARELGATGADTLSLGIVSVNSSGNKAATDDADGKLEMDSTIVAMTKDADGKVTSAICDGVQVSFTVTSDGGMTVPETIRTKLELGDDYGMIKRSELGKEWYEQSEGFCSYLVGKTADEIAGIPADGSDADLAASCTVGLTDLLAAALKAAQ